jgi:hypothetical protein
MDATRDKLRPPACFNHWSSLAALAPASKPPVTWPLDAHQHTVTRPPRTCPHLLAPPAADLFECFTVEGRVRAFTHSPATVDARPGGEWSWYGGSVAGKFLELDPPRRLVMEWCAAGGAAQRGGQSDHT